MYQYPFQAIECKLSDIKPNLIENPNGVWTEKSNESFAKVLNSVSTRFIMVTSLEQSTVMCKLSGLLKSNPDELICISDRLIANGIATKLTPAEEAINANRPKFIAQTFYIPNRESHFMAGKGKYTNVDTELKKSLANKNPYRQPMKRSNKQVKLVVLHFFPNTFK